jgi:hypothetical protein
MDGALVWGESHLARNAPCDGPVSDIAPVAGPAPARARRPVCAVILAGLMTGAAPDDSLATRAERARTDNNTIIYFL